MTPDETKPGATKPGATKPGATKPRETKPRETTTLFLARHGETVWHAENRYTGSSDIALTARGEEQAEALGRWAASARLDAIVASPLSRARRTAAPSLRTTGLPETLEPGLCELDFGIAEGRTLAEVEARDPDAVAEFVRAPATRPLPGGDDPVAAAARGADALWRVAEAHRGGRVLVVAHNTLYRLVLCHLLSIPLDDYRRVLPGLRNGAVTELRMRPGGQRQASLMSYNVPNNVPSNVPTEQPSSP
ncbi:histidine phosphatase family protein [Streptomyces bomunensis]|uniref:Histidine phosphatase family protein n=1 Tax=Streptomyces montanisoli TaxID=2798581 RepID=A0A940M9H3_9ACTN|nr:histidine phosphatase family protein [Streptomyces montanisoli]MBP0458759.1 histidine phosphatase family protein [Streptomyces montanisoli]